MPHLPYHWYFTFLLSRMIVNVVTKNHNLKAYNYEIIKILSFTEVPQQFHRSSADLPWHTHRTSAELLHDSCGTPMELMAVWNNSAAVSQNFWVPWQLSGTQQNHLTCNCVIELCRTIILWPFPRNMTKKGKKGKFVLRNYCGTPWQFFITKHNYIKMNK